MSPAVDKDQLVPNDNHGTIVRIWCQIGPCLGTVVHSEGSNTLINIEERFTPATGNPGNVPMWVPTRTIANAENPPARIQLNPPHPPDLGFRYAHDDALFVGLLELDATPGTLTWYPDADYSEV